MKRLSLLLLICFVLLPALKETDAQTNVTVRLQQPPPNQLRSTDIWNLTLTNTTRNTLQVSLFGTLEEAGAGIIVDGTSKEFSLPPGTKRITYDDVKTGNVNFKSGKWREAFTRTGNAPSGDYTICISVKNKAGEEIGADCINQTVEISGPPELISPADGEEITPGALPTFTWLPPMPTPPGAEYTLKIVELLGNQSPEEAFNRNITFFQRQGIKGTMFQYPLSEKKFETAKKYAWMVSTDDLKSDMRFFKISDLPIIKGDGGPCKLNNPELNVSLGSDGRLTICGTPGVDNVQVRLDPSKSKIEVDNRSNGTGVDYSFEFAKVSSIHVFLFAGDDWVIFDDTNGSLGILLPLEINVGDGDNTVIGSTGSLNAGEIADLGNTITKLRNVLETGKDIREHTEQLNRRGAEITAYYEMKFLKEAERFSTNAPEQLDSLTTVLNTLLGRGPTQMVEGEQEWYTRQVEQFEKSFRLVQEKNETYINKVLFADAVAFTQRLEKYVNNIDTSEAGRKKLEEWKVQMESELDNFEQVYSKLNLPGTEDMSKIDSNLDLLREKLTNKGVSLLEWSETELTGINDNEDGGDTIIIGNSRFVMSEKKLLEELNSMEAGADSIEHEANVLLKNISELVGKLGDGTRGGGKSQGTRGGCDFTTTNTITSSSVSFPFNIFIGTAANDDMTGSSGMDFMLGLGGSDRMHGGGGTDIMVGDLWTSGSSDDMFGDGGFDIMFGNGGDDCMSGGDSTDLMLGMDGRDIMHGNGGQSISFNIYNVTVTIEVGDLMFGMGDDDEMYGDESIDLMFGGSGKDVMHGNDCQDWMFGNTGDDDMWGEDGGGVKIDGIPHYPGNFMMGGSGLDEMWGGDHRDLMFGMQDDDIMNGGKKMDFMFGGSGKDVMHGDDGLDLMWGGGDDDIMNGDDGLDLMWGGGGDDIMNGDDGLDLMWGGTGKDVMHGGNGWDWMWGRAGDDIMNGDDGWDVMFGGTGKDMMHGNKGWDVMFGNGGEDEMYGDDGWDWMCGMGENDRMHGNEGVDVMFGNQCNDMMWGDDGWDFMDGGKDDDIMYGGDGVDVMLGDKGNDCMDGGNDPDFMFGGKGNDVMFGNDNMDWMEGNSGNDEMDGGNGVDWMLGGEGDDHMFGSNDFDFMLGNDDNDVMDGGAGASFMEGNGGNDVIHGGNNPDIIFSGSGDDCIDGNDGLINLMSGGEGNDNMLGGNGWDIMWGKENNDLMSGGNGFDQMNGGDGDDHMMGGNGIDIMRGKAGDDILDGGDGADIIIGGSGADQGCGGPGWDIHWSCETWSQAGSCSFTPTPCDHVAYPTQCGKTVIPCKVHDEQSCNCGSWDTPAVTYNGGSISCGGGATIPAGSNTLTPHYSCDPITPDCETTYLWSIDNGTPFAASTYSTNELSSGTHSISITPICGEDFCGQCTFNVTIDPDGCNCGSWDTEEAVTYNGGYINCGGEAILSLSAGPNILTPHYYCNPDNPTCQPIYMWSIDNGTPFAASTYSTNALSIGTHFVTLTPICGTDTCGQCTFNVIVNPDDCTCGSWDTPAVTYNGGSISSGGGATLPAGSNTLTPHYSCDPDNSNCEPIYTWSIDNGSPFAASTYSTIALSPGTHSVTITPICGTDICEECTFNIIVNPDSCDCGKWNSLVVDKKKYDCGSKIPWNCNRPFSFESSYLCNPNDESCRATTSWEIQKDNVLIQTGNGTNTITDSFTPTENGIYIITLNATCNDIKCPPCTYVVVVEDCNSRCDCGKWNPLVVDKNKYDCGSKIPWNCNRPFSFESAYLCNPNDESCRATTSWEIQKDNVLIQTGNGTNTITDSFTPTENGIYIITLNATCNDIKCPPCTYVVVVEDCNSRCDCGKWNPLVVDKNKYDCGSKIPWNCNRPFSFESAYLCNPNDESCRATTSWEIQKDNVLIQTGNGTNTITDSFTPTENGIYIITLNATCNDIKCPPCTYVVVVEDCNSRCDCTKDMYVIVNPGGFKIRCKETMVLDYGTTINLIPQNICDPADCLTGWSMKVFDTQSGALITTGNGSGNSSSLVLTLNSTEGYRIELVGNCNGNKCSCEFWIETKR